MQAQYFKPEELNDLVGQDLLFNFSIDRGGTFTDIYCEIFNRNDTNKCLKYLVYKLLSEDNLYGDGPREGIRRIISDFTQTSLSLQDQIPAKYIRSLRMGTTVATNALLERKGVRTCLVVTKGFRDLLLIGNQSRPNIFDLTMQRPEKIFETVLEVNERVRILKPEEISQVNLKQQNYFHNVQDEVIEILTKLDIKEIEKDLINLKEKGIESLSVVLMHSPSYPLHEQIIGDIAQKIGFKQISLSNVVMPMVKIVQRGYTATLDAYLNPYINNYINKFVSGFDEEIKKINVFFMQSDGGLSSIADFRGSRSILSGPAGGVIGFSETSSFMLKNEPNLKGIIGFDMGGTSTDVSRFDGKNFQHIFDAQIAGVQIQTPHLDINTVAAGGGSRLFYENKIFRVGPESSGSTPGPVCYGNNGQLSITDANLMLGRLIPKFFPKIFGANKNSSLFKDKTIEQFEILTKHINQQNNTNMSIHQVAYGFVKVANETMCRPIRTLTQGKGSDPRHHVLSIFGGAGAQHACEIAKTLGIKKVFIHNFAGILSAYGLAKADVVEDSQQPFYQQFDQNNINLYNEHLNNIKQNNLKKLYKLGFQENHFIRYNGTDTNLLVLRPEDDQYLNTFLSQHQQEFGFILQSKDIKLDFLRVRSIANFNVSEKQQDSDVFESYISQDQIECKSKEPAYFENENNTLELYQTKVYDMNILPPSAQLHGPTIILNQTSTILIPPDWICIVTKQKNLSIFPKNAPFIQQIDNPTLDPIVLSIFGNRFMSIAEQMGRTLQKTACSTNIKERLDFSCALFAPNGNLVANAPHLPVHLGSMQETVKWQIKHLDGDWKEKEVILSNHPGAGGSHLPDITIITPVWDNGKVIFYVASRGHHADIGGISPGSMPPFSRSLAEEGVAIKSFKIVKDEIFQYEETVKKFTEPPEGQGTRLLQDNLSDLKAQIAANNRGEQLIKSLIQEYGLSYVHSYMNYIQENAEECVRTMLVQISEKNGLKEIDTIEEKEFMDDGSPIQLALTIDRKQRSAHFDFSGTGLQVLSNINCPKSVTMSAIIQ